MKLMVRRMTTSREDRTKHEHFVTLVNDQGQEMDLYMSYDPEKAYFQALEIAQFMGVACDPLVIDGQPVQLSSVSLLMLDRERT